MVEIAVRARAKVNLALHVVGRRADGYHLLDSLVVFADLGDEITLRPDPGLALTIGGPMAAGLDAGPENLVLRAAALMGGGAAIHLDKRLPVASGIGGGSADAAATLRGMAQLTGRALPAAAEVLGLGADVPVCLQGHAARMEGIGEIVTPLDLPEVAAVLVNPGFGVSTPEVFRALERRDHPGMGAIPRWSEAAGLIDWLRGTRNDLEAAALRVAPGIGAVLAALAESGALLARMSGSGATCFGLYPSLAEAEAAAARLARPGWWVAPTRLGHGL
jgi:4-diphosphocytidyl-2-C-methyl-D-erythritol kinase